MIPGHATLLTSRQWQVATLVAGGYSNRQVAQALVLTSGTVARHVEQILRRLGLQSRGQLAAWGVEQGLTTTQDRLLTVLQQLLAIQAPALKGAMDEAAQLVADALGCEKVDAFLHDPSCDTLIALGTSDTPMGRKQRALGLDRLPVANGGCAVKVFRARTPHRDGRVDQDPDELVGIRQGLGVCSDLAVPLEVAGKVRGVLMAVSARPEFFAERDLDFLRAASYWVGSVAHRAELMEEIGRHAAAAEAVAVAEAGRNAAQRSQALAEAALQDAEIARRNLQNFLAMVAHDLRTPLTAISGFAQVLARPNQGEAVRERAVATIRRETERMALLIQDIVDAGLLGVGSFVLKPRPTDLMSVVRTVVEAQQHATDRHCLLVHGPGALVVEGDPDRLGQALTNLVANAIKYSPSGGEIRVRVGSDGDQAVVSIADQGIGLRPEDLHRLFEPFSRLDAGAEIGGAGLGLYISRGIIEAHGGRIWAESPGVGQGTTFTVALPVPS